MTGRSVRPTRPGSILRCAILAIAFCFPITAMLALSFRFPVPFAGYVSGPDAVVASVWALTFYARFGLLAPVLALAAAGGLTVPASKAGAGARPSPWEAAVALLAAALPLVGLSVLDVLIGPW